MFNRAQDALLTYPLSPQAIRAHIWRMFWHYQFAVTISFLVLGVFISTGPRPVNIWLVGGIVLILGLAYFFFIFNAYRKKLRELQSVRVEIDHSHVTVRQLNRQPVRVSRADVSDIYDHPEGIMITTVQTGHKLLVPSGLANDGDQEVRRILSIWMPFSPSTRAGHKVNWMMFWFSVAGGLLILTLANSLWIAVPLAVFLFFFGTYAENRLNLRYMVDPRITRAYSIAFSFLIILIVAKSCLVMLMSFR